MAISGAPKKQSDHAHCAMEFAIDVVESMRSFNAERNADLRIRYARDTIFICRVGMNSGAVVGGVIGKVRMQFDVWGDSVNVASRMESTGVENKIQVSEATYNILKNDYLFEERGHQEVKGKGKMLTYLFKERKLCYMPM